MRAVKSRDTGPERAVRKLAWSIAPGYRLNRRDLPGTPDIVYVSRRLAIFVHGCFWHGHGCARSTEPKTNRAFWRDKIARNRARDARVAAKLRRAGWRVVTIHECALDRSASVEAKLRRALAGVG
ncbi:MAG: DNA mismatch endonuclease Vsr [Hyphomicrobiales bacterium]|nr:DNA mismatch endonuclease Vsr [Hyphomicrobiales bacterium]